MSEYRDELGAAHARIAELEAEVAALKAPPVIADGRFPELEAEVARLQTPADGTRNGRIRTRIAVASIVFPLLGMTFSFFHEPFYATMMSAFFITLTVTNMLLARRLPVAKARLKAAEARLADARRIVELEQQLRVRVVAPADAPMAEELPSDEAEEPKRTLRS